MISNLLVLLAPLAMATLNTNAERGEKVVHFEQPGRTTEICVVPRKLPGAVYSKKDLENEQLLCSLNSSVTAAVCPKENSSNPGVDFFSIPQGYTAAQVEAAHCEIPNPANEKDSLTEKLAKYKSSTSCSYTPSLLAYYHVARALGNIDQTPVSTARTMDRNRHIALGRQALEDLQKDPNDLIFQTWTALVEILQAGPSSPKRDLIFTDSFDQSYGALMRNPTKESKYSKLWIKVGANQDRAVAFRDQSPYYARLVDATPIKQSLGGEWTQDKVQSVLLLQNISDMIVLDTILSQQDRFGNIHSTKAYYFLEHTAEGTRLAKAKKMDAGEIQQKNAVQVEEMMLKDNDCGVNKDNIEKKAGLLRGLTHVNPATYERLLKLNADLALEATKTFFKQETLMTEKDFNLFKQNTAYAVQTLTQACREGRLQMDLDLDFQFAGKAPVTCNQ